MGLQAFAAHSATPLLSDDAPRAPASAAAEGIQLAQLGDVEIYYDEFGRRVVVDAYTGEIISVERPRRSERRVRRDEMRARRDAMRGEERFYLDDPNDMERLRREKMREQGIVVRPPPAEDGGYARELPEGIDDYPVGAAPRLPRRAGP